jgi:F-type H+-transporting ATPase subunit a
MTLEASGVPTLGELFDFKYELFGQTFLSWTVLSMFIGFALVSIFLLAAFKNPQVVPGKLQLMGESVFDFIRTGIAEEVIGHEGARYVPYLTTLFLLIFSFNVMEIFPGIAFPATSHIAIPAFLAGVTWVVYNVEGIRSIGFFTYFKGILFPPGVPKFMYILLTPIEFLSIIVIRPITLTLRLTFNMVAGHLILGLLAALCISLWVPGPKAIALPFAVAIGAALTGFELFVAFLQAFIFTILTALYIGGAIHPEH